MEPPVGRPERLGTHGGVGARVGLLGGTGARVGSRAVVFLLCLFWKEDRDPPLAVTAVISLDTTPRQPTIRKCVSNPCFEDVLRRYW
jgi:hypothetical protein